MELEGTDESMVKMWSTYDLKRPASEADILRCGIREGRGSKRRKKKRESKMMERNVREEKGWEEEKGGLQVREIEE